MIVSLSVNARRKPTNTTCQARGAHAQCTRECSSERLQESLSSQIYLRGREELTVATCMCTENVDEIVQSASVTDLANECRFVERRMLSIGFKQP